MLEKQGIDPRRPHLEPGSDRGLQPVSGSSASGHLDAAQSIGRRLVDEAVWWEGRCTWLGDSVEQVGWWLGSRSSVARGGSLRRQRGRGVVPRPALRERVVTMRIRRTAEGALRNALARASADPVPGGLYHGATRRGRCRGRGRAPPRLLGAASQPGRTSGAAIADGVATADDRTGDFDVVGGMAGSVLGLLALASREHDPDLVAAARAAGDRLIDCAERRDAGWCWPSPEAELAGAAPLCGLAHGAAGVAWALR